jgi:hypothetical protein
MPKFSSRTGAVLDVSLTPAVDFQARGPAQNVDLEDEAVAFEAALDDATQSKGQPNPCQYSQ